MLHQEMFRVEVDYSDDKFNKKIRNAVTSKVPNMWILGGDEVEARSITWRRYAVQAQETMPLDNAVTCLRSINSQRLMDNFDDVELPK